MKRKLATIVLMGMIGLGNSGCSKRIIKEYKLSKKEKIRIEQVYLFGAPSSLFVNVTKYDTTTSDTGRVRKMIEYAELGLVEGQLQRITVTEGDSSNAYEGWPDKKIIRAGQYKWQDYLKMGSQRDCVREWRVLPAKDSKRDSLTDREKRAIGSLE